MKKNIFLKGLAGMLVTTAVIPVMTSCSSDYLEEAPITEISKADVANTLDGALYAMQGACSSMYRQQRGYPNWNNANGEPYLNVMYGEAPANTFHDRIWNVYYANLSNWSAIRNQGEMMAYAMWRFCYGVIDAANQVLDVIDDVPVSSDRDTAERDFIKATCLTVRAHCYTKLMQVYGPRWVDSNNGAANSAIVLRLQSGLSECPFATTGEVMESIFNDLNQAITLFNGSSYSDDYIWTPNVDVAHGLKARAAAIKASGDSSAWQMVRDEAKAARANYPIMTAEQYVKGGFIQANQEYMWATWFQSEGMYYDGHGGTYGCNGWTVLNWGVSCGIDFDLYRNIPLTDCRKGLYIAPGFFELDGMKELADEVYADMISDPDYSGISISQIDDNSFFNPSIVDASSMTLGNGKDPSLKNFVYELAFDTSRWPDNQSGMPLTSAWPDGGAYPYYSATYMMTGLQYKFWGVDTFGTNQFPFMRASEMAYLEAEAEYMLGDIARAQAIMVELNKDKRDPNFTCTETGEALLNKIRTYRHIELWGEGFAWHDYKRWNITMHRSEWLPNDPTSGNYPKSLANDCNPSDNCGWRVSVPTGEFSYNKAVSVEELPDSNR